MNDVIILEPEKRLTSTQKNTFILLVTGFCMGDKSISSEIFNNINKLARTELDLAYEMCVGLMKDKRLNFNV